MSTRTMKMPDLGEGIVEAELVSWFVSTGDRVTTTTPIADVQTDKASVEITAPVDGVIAGILVEAGAIVPVGADILAIETGQGQADPVDLPAAGTVAQPALTAAPESPETRRADQVAGRPPRPIAAPTVRLLAKELDIDLQDVAGTGPNGRILRADVESHVSTAGTVAGHVAHRPDQIQQLRGIRRAVAHHLTKAWKAPHITLVEDVDVTELESLREALKDSLAQAGVRLTPLTFIARAVVLACAQHPQCNATFDAETETLTQHGAVHLGVATQTDRGLVVPVVREADRLSLSDMALQIAQVAELARDGRAQREQLRGSTITISSLGALGGLMNTPILNAPEVAVVGVNRMRTEPVWNGMTFMPRTILHLSASFDHRIIDGWDAAIFLRRVKELLETPGMLSLDWTR